MMQFAVIHIEMHKLTISTIHCNLAIYPYLTETQQFLEIYTVHQTLLGKHLTCTRY